MKIQFWSVGKPHETFVQAGIEDFTQRIQNYFSIEWVIIKPVKNAATLSVSELKKEEATKLLNILQKDDYLILLDERGQQFTSVALAEFFQQRANAGHKKIIFLIGGAFGVDDVILNRADFVWSLSKLVFPHMLVRLILAEQVYRACTILKNEKYHHL
ncbi:MAG: 23S rRNA (pseudouridine(1915)-N(3))-methyltransferase RlmH [Hydrotalea flava]|uniref:23S rRNA (pseudouridine(1915)-N(3))-methyltransferase RlmH n=1 Tax=Hydrotalea TaxID=1004300 RepID=UPI00169AE4D7|nr:MULTISPECIES: 23S rRNA (pseudouridine(1915)-N(3))-methyltransferase RlmH [Hydrotalea]NIM35209.1 23S rRNA (pseudouridine(1915)-N(3))-methyltransferase RlmH [Hydrotalea flava]NIM38036.1 23S rRNA (pseudouridine(1915)-N(3))-methyltransferase RlmH [Hydrotalea flava]NIN03206.1 23S rRNA (pseudouridine(1915)-N(3))-methyltransferase RlmH [Hydrotalea flava]NIN14894.1 23S rRNA (pseudouridine(1915)-N(3))-methyltransferase RlmH [Hydrotalea flava]NIO93962.1 23S rRNA (pseudouridine(1915)-N(3))-methyltrans